MSTYFIDSERDWYYYINYNHDNGLNVYLPVDLLSIIHDYYCGPDEKFRYLILDHISHKDVYLMTYVDYNLEVEPISFIQLDCTFSGKGFSDEETHRNPIQNGTITDQKRLIEMWRLIIEYTKINPSRSIFVFIESAYTTQSDREMIAKIVFETFDFRHLYFENQSVLTLIQKSKTTGIVLDIGEDYTTVLPIYEGYPLRHAADRTPIASQALNLHMQRLISQRGYSRKGNTTLNIAQRFKECFGYVALDYDEEMKQDISVLRKGLENWPTGIMHFVEYERFQCPELLFNPSKFGNNNQGIVELIYNSIMKCDRDLHEELLKNIALSGGDCLLIGIVQRLEKELRIKLKENLNLQTTVEVVSPNPSYNPNIVDRPILQIPLYCCCPVDVPRTVSKTEYHHEGPKILHQKFF